ncbi:MAG TPA: TIGR03617 family F420-dependent LLM class oxidoreductase [Acidimicrobiales bacterium]|nr:TIGR03617 family F420-dependent LLM class oxidoreductase [Acidimicrobiales bacterium]
MKVYAGMDPATPLRDVAAYARRVEAMGYDGLQVAETVHDGLALAMLALEHTERIVVRTSVILAFVRSPMLVAYTAWDLAAMSDGRFELGLGTQIKQNIEGRFSVPWREPVARMSEYLDALRAIFATFATGAPLRFEGEHYQFTRMQPYFNPGPIATPAPRLWLGGVNPKICRVAGAKADGFITHPTNSNPRYLAEIALPNLRAGADGVARDPSAIELVVGSPYITGSTASVVAAEREHQRHMLAFLYSTPAYRRTLELFGWADLGERLQRMTREGRWDELATLVTDEVLDALVPQGTYDELPAVIARWFGDIATGVLVQPPRDPADDPLVGDLIRAIRAL